MTDTSALLPFVMRHGPAIWWGVATLGIVASVAGGFAFTRWTAHRAERRRASEEAAGAILRGTLRGAGRGVQVQSVESTGPATASARWRAPGLWLETDQGRVTLEGPITVVAGTISRTVRAGIPREAHRELATQMEATNGTATTLRGLRDGDDVVASGHLESIASPEPSAYRESAPTLVLRPGGGASIRLTARRPRAPKERPPYASIAVLSLVLALAGWKFADAQGDRWQRECSSGREGASIALSNTHACALMMATPGERDVGSLIYALRNTSTHDAQWRRTVVAVGVAGARCADTIDLLASDEQFADVVTVARACHLPRLEYRALAQLGRFEEAADVHVPYQPGVVDLPSPEVYIAARRWTDAAGALDAAREATRTETDDPERQPLLDAKLAHYSCAADLARFYGGDTTALGRIRATYATPSGAACAAAVYELSSAAERASFAADRDRPRSLEQQLALTHLQLADDPAGGTLVASPSDAVRAPLDAYFDLPFVWLMKTRTAPPSTSVELAWAAVAATYDARYADGIALAKRAVAAAAIEDAGRFPRHADLEYLAGSIALYTPITSDPILVAPAAPKQALGEWNFHGGHVQLRSRTVTADTYLGPESTLADALRAAMNGDGTKLVEVMSAKYSWWHDIDAMAVLPRVTNTREQIATLLETHRSTDSGRTWYGSRKLFEVAARAIQRRGVLALAGRAESAAAWDAIYRRYDRVLSDRKRLVMLMVVP